jgi:hypothetical protein
MKKEKNKKGDDEKKCPLELKDWVNYLTFEQNRERYDYYNEEISFLTNIIIILTMILGLIGILQIIITFDILPSEVVFWFTVISGIIFIGILFYTPTRWNYFKSQKKLMITRIDKEGELIQDILWAKETDSQKIRERYHKIFENKEIL